MTSGIYILSMKNKIVGTYLKEKKHAYLYVILRD